MIDECSTITRILERSGIERRFAIDIASVALGVRPRALLHVPSASSERIVVSLQQLGLVCVARRNLVRHQDPCSREGLLSSCAEGVRDASEQWTELWFQCRGVPVPSTEELFDRTGSALGYPACCVSRFASVRSLDELYVSYLLEDKPGYWEINRLAAVFCSGFLMPDFFPCSLSCRVARDFVTSFHDVASALFAESQCATWRRAMQAVYFVLDGQLVFAPDWRCTANTLVVDSASASRAPLASIGREVGRLSVHGFRVLPFTHQVADIQDGGGRFCIRSTDGSVTELGALKYVRSGSHPR